MLPEKYLESDVQYEVPYTKTIDFETNLENDDRTDANLITELRTKANIYLQENKVPKISYTVKSDINDKMEIGDTIQILHPLLSIKTEVLEYEYDNILGKVKRITFGNFTRSIKNKFDNIKTTLNKISNVVSNQEIVINRQTDLINSLNKNGYVYIDDNEILILDRLPKEQATNVWRWGLGGLGFSSHGYEGPFETAITMDGQINANFITTGQLSVSRIEGLANTLNEHSRNISTIELDINGITNTVNSVETKVNNLQIGARNLALNTRKFFNAGRSGTIGNGLEGTPELLEDTFTPSGYCAKYQYKQSSEKAGIYLMKGLILGTNAQKMKADEIYTLSFYAKASTSTSFSSAGIFAEGQTIITPANLNLTTEWKRFYTTFKWTNTTKLTTCFYIPQGDVTLYLSSFKLEEGNIPTDWVPAPEDIESNLESNYYTKTETESKIDQRADSITSTVSQNYSTKAETTQAKNEAINSANTSTDNKLTNYSTTTQMNSAITQKANEITSTVSTIEDKLDNIQVGGTNLLRGTNTVTTLGTSSAWSSGTWRRAGGGTGTRTSISVSDAPNANIKIGWSTASTSGQVLICQDNVPTTAGEIYTISCYAKGTGKITLQYGNETLNYITSMQTITDENNWKKYSYTFTSRGTANAYFGSGNTNNNVSFCGLKIEKGNIATDWSPAPEDITANYYTKTETNSQITQKASEIVSTVNKTISNIQTGTENLLINTAIKENTNNWSLASGITRTTDKTTPNGNYCFYYNISGVTSNSWRCANPSYVSVQPGEILTADVNVFIPSSNDIDGEVALGIQYFNSSRTRIGYLKKLIDTTIVDKWQKATVTLEAPTNTAYANARVWVLKNGKFYVGDLMLSRGNTSTSWTPSSKDYSTTTEMNSAITQKANEINIEVAKKVGNDEVISKINQSAEQIEIGANKLNILGKKVKFTTNIEGNYTFSQSDLDKIVAYIMGEGTLTSSEKELYDINKDGMVRATDYVKIKNAINNNNGTINVTGTFEIDPDSAKRSLILRDSSGNIITSVGLLGMQTQSLGAERIESIDAIFQNLTVEGTFTNNSDKRLKTDIVKLDNKYTNLIKDIDPVIFTYKKSNQRHIGFIAQDVEQAFNKENIEPTLVKKDDLGIYSLDYIQLIGILWKDNKIKNELIEDLKSRIEKLEKK